MADTQLPTPLTNEQIRHINRRAKKLAQTAYEDYRSRMMKDPLVTSGHTKPQDWCPIDAVMDAQELIRAVANSLSATSRSLNHQADRLAKLSENNT
jgi:hypothetical protein